MSTDHLFLIDGSSFVYRAYHALPPLTRKSDGLPTGAVSGFCNMLYRLIESAQEKDGLTHLAVVFDVSGKNFRHRLFPGYKAKRPTPPADIRTQLKTARLAAKAFGAACVEKRGYEADDLIATYARIAREAGARVTIVSVDKDLMQLVSDDVDMLDTMKMKTIRRAEVIEKFGVPPEKVVDVQALAGDSVDNVPGVPGIGIKTAAELINQYGDLERLLARASEIKQPKRRGSLIAYAHLARLSKQLVTLNDQVRAPAKLSSLCFSEIDIQSLTEFCKEMEFHALRQIIAGDIDVVLGDTGQLPTDLYKAFAWWRDALAGQQPPIDTEPRCGFFTRRLIKGGPLVPVAVWIDQTIDESTGLLTDSERMVCTVGSRESDPVKEWTYIAASPISEEEYRYLMATKEWAEKYAPAHPAAQPHVKIDPLSIAPVF